jgi:hypothetical protein
MTQKDFFNAYIPALIKAINTPTEEEFDVKGPDWYLGDNVSEEMVNEFILRNRIHYEDFFYLIDLYFDSRAHYYQKVESKFGDMELIEVKEKILALVGRIQKKSE